MTFHNSDPENLLAAGGNSRAARSLRVKSQLRDRFGRWVEMGRKASIDIKVNGVPTKIIGTFVGGDNKAPAGKRGLFLVEADEQKGIERGVYSFSGRAVKQVLASLDPEYLARMRITDPKRDVKNNLVGKTLDEDIENIEDVYREDVGELDEALASGTLNAEEVNAGTELRIRTNDYQPYNVVATLEEADTEVLTEDQLKDILEEAGVTPDETVRPEPPKEEAPRKATPEELRPKTPEVEPVSDDIRDGVRPVEDLPRQIGRDARIPDDRVPDSKPPVAVLKTADRLVPGDIVKMPDGTTRKVVRNNSVDSGSLVTFEPKEGERRGTYKTYRDDDLVEIEQEPVARIEEPAPQVEEPVQQPDEDVDASGKTQALLDIEEALGREMTPAELLALGSSAIGISSVSGVDFTNPPSGAEIVESGTKLADELFEVDSEKFGDIVKVMDARFGTSRPGQADRVDVSRRTTDYDPEKVQDVLLRVRDYITANKKLKEAFPDENELLNSGTEDPELRIVRDMAHYMSGLIERSGGDETSKEASYTQLTLALKKDLDNKVASKAGETPRITGRADTVRKVTAKKDGTTIDPITMKQPRTGIAVAVQGTNEEVPDVLFYSPLGDLIVADYVDRYKDKIREGFKLGTWHDKDSNEVTFDIVQVFPEGRIEQATVAGQERNQQGIFNLRNKDYIPTGGTGDRGRARRNRELSRGEVRVRPEPGQQLGANDASRESGEGAPDSGADAGELEKVVFKKLDAAGHVPIFDLADIDFSPEGIDVSRLSLGQRVIFRKLLGNRERLFNLLVDTAKKKDGRLYQKVYSLVAAATDVAKRYIRNAQNNRQFNFGSGEKQRLQNMVFFSDSIERVEAENNNSRITRLHGVYTAKNGVTYYLKYDQAADSHAGVFEINADGSIGKELAYVKMNWSGERNLPDRPTEEPAVGISYLSSSQGGDGLAGVAVTLARYVAESSGREFSHSQSLTDMGASNSKAIEPNNPRRHHYSQSEKVLWMMKAPTIDVMRKLGWFRRDSILGYPGIASFEKPIDVTGQTNSARRMTGPAYQIDAEMIRAVGAIPNELRTGPIVSQANVGYANLRIQFMLEDLNWKDGISKKDAVEKLRGFQKALTHYKENRPATTIQGEQTRRVDKLENIFKQLADALEADEDFDSKRLDRPQKLDLDAPMKIELFGKAQEFYSMTNEIPPFKGVSDQYSLHNFEVLFDPSRYGSVYRNPRNVVGKASYQSTYGADANLPALWTPQPSGLARRFSSDQLFDSLEEGIKKAVGTTSSPNINASALLDFRRDYAEEPDFGNVPLASVAQALNLQGATKDGVPLKEWIAEQIDKATGREDNLKEIDKLKQNDVRVIQKIEEFLADKVSSVEAAEEALAKINQSAESEKEPDFYFDEKLGAAVGLKSNIPEDNFGQPSERFNSPLIQNDVLDLPNGFGEVLAAESISIPYAVEQVAIRNFNASLVKATIAEKFRKEDLEKAFLHAIDNQSEFVKLKFAPNAANPDGYIQPTPITIVRDTLQIMGVDTNALVRQRAKSLNQEQPSSEEVSDLAQQGRITALTPAQVLSQIGEPVDISGWTYIDSPSVGVTRPSIFEDPQTGIQYLVKRFSVNQKANAENEIFTQAFYRLAGISATVPRRGFKPGDNSNYVISEYLPSSSSIDYKTALNRSITPEEIALKEQVRNAVLNGLPVDILVDNIDGAFNSGNTLIGPNNEVTRIDGGGGLTTDPIPSEGLKTKTNRYKAMWTIGRTATDEDKKLLEIAKRDGTFSGEGIEFGLSFYLDNASYHWNATGAQRPKVLGDSFDKSVLTDRVAEVLSKLNPNSIRELLEGMENRDEANEIAKTLIYRRAKMLSHFGLEDTFNPNAEKLVNVTAEPADFDRLRKYVDLYSTKENDFTKVLPYRRATEDASLTKDQIDELINEITTRISEEVPSDRATEQPEEDRAQEVADVVADLPVATDLEEVPSPGEVPQVISTVSLAALQPNDLIMDSDLNFRVVANIRRDDTEGRTLILKDDTGAITVRNFNNSDIFSNVIRPSSEVETTFREGRDALNASRVRQINRLKARSNAVINDVKDAFPNAVQLSNGDLVVASRNFTAVSSGKSYRYEVLVHRKPNEEFVTYVREVELDRDGNQIGNVRINKMSAQSHSSRALLNKINPLVRGGSVGKGVYGRNPRNWFNQGRNIESEVLNPSTGLPIPQSLAPMNMNATFVGNTGITSTGDPVKDAIIIHIASLVERGVDDVTILRRLRGGVAFSPNKIIDFIERIEANRAFPGVNQIPYVSRDGQNIVRVGDRVRHFSPDGSVKEGVVRLRRPLSVSQKAQGEYGYTDVVVIKFDGRSQGTPIVTSNLQVLTRRDGTIPESANERPPSTESFTEPAGLLEGWSVQISDTRATYSSPNSPTTISVVKTPTSENPNEVRYEEQTEGARGGRVISATFNSAGVAQTYAEQVIARFERNRVTTPEAPEAPEVAEAPEAPESIPTPESESPDQVTANPGTPEEDEELPEIKNELPEEQPKDEIERLALQAAMELRARAEKLEPGLTEMVRLLVKKFGGVMVGLPSRLKSTKSLIRKIMVDAKQDYNGDVVKAASKISDVVRYTAKIDSTKYTETVLSVIAQLEADGYELKIKNYWTDDPENTYRGINIKMIKDGVISELQLHTEESIKEKESRLTELYQEIRVLAAMNPPDRLKINNLAQRMSQIAASIKKPARYVELQRIGELLSQSFTV
jgi:hypothetical protein